MGVKSGGKRAARPTHTRKNIDLWILVPLLLILLGAGGYFLLARNSVRFAMVSGEKSLVVLLRNDEQGVYRARYEGRQPVDLRSLHVMLAGQILHVDVKQVVLSYQGEEIILEPDGKLPSGMSLQLPPGAEFEVKVTFVGQSLGGNYMYGFRIGYGSGDQETLYELRAGYDYAIVVE